MILVSVLGASRTGYGRVHSEFIAEAGQWARNSRGWNFYDDDVLITDLSFSRSARARLVVH